MRGHVRRRGAKWCVVVDVGRGEDGKRRQKWHSGFRTRRDAESALARIVGAIDTGTYIEPSKITLGEFLQDKWLPSIRVRVRPSTYRSYEMIVRVHVVPRVGRLPLRRLTGADLDRVYGELLRDGRQDGKPLSARSVRYAHAVIRHALEDAVVWGLVPRNAASTARAVPRAARNRQAIRAWNAGELRVFLDARARDRLAAMWRTLAMTGMRRGEALGLPWDAVDLDAGRLEVRRALIAVGYQVEFSEPKTDRGRRSISLDATTVDALKAHRRRQAEERLKAGPAWEDSGLVFCDELGRPLHPDAVTKAFARHVRDAGLPRISVHGLRHTSASLALAAGVHVKVVSERLGHATVAMTLDTYSHVIPALQEDAAARIAALVLEP